MKEKRKQTIEIGLEGSGSSCLKMSCSPMQSVYATVQQCVGYLGRSRILNAGCLLPWQEPALSSMHYRPTPLINRDAKETPNSQASKFPQRIRFLYSSVPLLAHTALRPCLPFTLLCDYLNHLCIPLRVPPAIDHTQNCTTSCLSKQELGLRLPLS